MPELFAGHHERSGTQEDQRAWLWNRAWSQRWGWSAAKRRRVDLVTVSGDVADVVRVDGKISEDVGRDISPHGKAEIVEMRSACREWMRNGDYREERAR